MTRILLILAALMLVGGCSVQHQHKHSTSKKMVVKSSPSRCKIVGKKIGKYSTVTVRKNCLKNGRTEVVVALTALRGMNYLSKDKMVALANKGIEESVLGMISILGFKPRLSSMGIVSFDGVPCYLFIVTGTSLD